MHTHLCMDTNLSHFWGIRTSTHFLFYEEHKNTPGNFSSHHHCKWALSIWSLIKKNINGNGVHATFIPFKNTFYLMHYVLIYPSQIKQRLATTYGNLINDIIWFMCFILVHWVILIFFNVFLQMWMSTTLNPASTKISHWDWNDWTFSFNGDCVRDLG